MPTAYQHTKNIGSHFQNAVSQVKTFYCREDFSDTLKRYRKAPKDATAFIRKELDAMCRARGLETESLLRDPQILDTIPCKGEILDHLVEIFYDLRNAVPSAHDYMKRIVHRLAPEYKNDSVRVAILKKFVLGAGADCSVYNTASIVGWAVDRMDAGEKALYKTAGKNAQLEMAVQKLDDSIFYNGSRSAELTWKDTLLLIKKRDGQQSMAKVINAAGEEIDYPRYEVDCQTLNKKLCLFLGLAEDSRCPAAELIDILLCAEEAQCPPKIDLAGLADSLEKGFKAHLKQFTYRTKKGSIVKLAEKYKDDRKYAKEQQQTGDWKLLTLCEDLAQGAFKTNNRQTRINLYRFAMMFHMTIALQATDITDPERDIRKNLFEDYYCDNLVRYLGQSPLDLSEASGWEKEPSGEGINLKNYAEAIYIYYLYRQDLALTPGQRITHAENAIEVCKNAPTQIREQLPSDAYTQYYAEIFTDHILNADEKDLTKLILGNYLIHGAGATPIQKASQQITASEFFHESLAFLEDGRETDYALGGIAQYRKDQIEEIANATTVSFDWRIASLLKERYSQDTDFVRLLDKLESRLIEEFDWISGRKKEILALTLQALYHHSSSRDPIGMEKLKKCIQKNEPAINGALILEAAERLRGLGFDVQRLSGNSESLFFLGARDYDDDTMNRILKKVETRYAPDIAGLRKLFTHMLAGQEAAERTVTRTTVLSICLIHYVELFYETEGILSFPDLYGDFAAYVNPILTDCRFQPLHEKNILDMYIILSLFFYITENGSK